MPDPLKPANPWCWPRPIGSPSDPSAADAWDEGFAAAEHRVRELEAERDKLVVECECWEETHTATVRDPGNAMARAAERALPSPDGFVVLADCVAAWRAVAGTEGKAPPESIRAPRNIGINQFDGGAK